MDDEATESIVCEGGDDCGDGSPITVVLGRKKRVKTESESFEGRFDGIWIFDRRNPSSTTFSPADCRACDSSTRKYLPWAAVVVSILVSY